MGRPKVQFEVGDLVIAKVKGYPAWPAQISNPKDWNHLPVPTKYFVEFYGTGEIAFVEPADIQLFTNESRRKVLARCKGNTDGDFSLAVKEICEAFDARQLESLDEPGETICLSEATTEDSEDEESCENTDPEEIEEKNEQEDMDEDSSSDELHVLEHSSQEQKGTALCLGFDQFKI